MTEEDTKGSAEKTENQGMRKRHRQMGKRRKDNNKEKDNNYESETRKCRKQRKEINAKDKQNE